METVYGWYKLQLEIKDTICLSQQRKKTISKITLKGALLKNPKCIIHYLPLLHQHKTNRHFKHFDQQK